MGLLDAIDSWPVDHVGAAAVLPDGTVVRHGETATVRPIASVTKVVVAVAVLVAVEEGSLDLDAAAGPPGATIRHLLAHASGLGPDGDEPVAPPATRRVYSNRGFDLLGDALSAATGMPVRTYVDEAVLQPLGMGSSRLAGSPAHAMSSTVDDLVALAVELWRPEPRLLAPSTRDLATTMAWPGLAGVLPGFGPQRANDWGLGVEVRGAKSPHWTPDAASPATFGHFGRSGSLLWVDPHHRTALVVLADREFGDWAPPLWRALGADVLAAAGDRDFGPERQEPLAPADVGGAVENEGSTP